MTRRGVIKSVGTFGLVLSFAGMLVLTAARPALAQNTGAIAGSVKDTTGGVLPGVTVEAASPALIEKVRSVVTDDRGEYKIVDLRPGTYTVTFTLTGFNGVKREGLELIAGVTLPVSAELKVGSLSETITVTGESPVVDVQNSRTQQVLNTATTNELPAGAFGSLMSIASLTLGASISLNDVGGDKSDQAASILLHGGRGDDGRTNWDGMNANVFFGNGGGEERVYYFNTVGVQEVVVDTGGNSVESESGGANVNMVPKDGGNTFSVFGNANFANTALSSTAISSADAARGAVPRSSVKMIWDYGVGIGGPLVKNKLWFYMPNRWWGAQNYGVGNYFNSSTNPNQYVPDLSKPAYTDEFFVDDGVRLTWQVASKHKITQEEHLQHGCSCWLAIGFGALSDPEATTDYNYGPQVLSQTTWSFTATNRLLIQAGVSFLRQNVSFVNGVGASANYFNGIGTPTFPGPNVHSITDLSTGFTWNAMAGSTSNYGLYDNSDNYNQKVSLSYVTGSHAFKAGVQTLEGNYYVFGMQNGVSQVDYSYASSGAVAGGPILNAVPVSLTEFAGPFQSFTQARQQSVYASDQWTLGRLTVNYGLRFDHFDAYDLPAAEPAGQFQPSRSYPGLYNVPNFKDVTPRLGVAYDVFGNGKTALKVAFGRYLQGQGGGLAQSVAPSVSIVTSVSRSWNDANQNFVPDCNLQNSAANGECGPITNLNFGQPVPNVTIAPNASQGWFNREYNYQTSVQLQQELRPGFGVAIGYFRTWWGNMTVLDNTALTSADYTQYCITEPTDARLGPYSGSQVCGLYDVNPAHFGQVNNVITKASSLGLGTPQEVYNGIDIGVSARWGKGALLTGGMSVGRESTNDCYANGQAELTPEAFPNFFGFAQYPRSNTFCNVTSSWWDGIGSQVKLQVVYPLPYGFQVSGTYKNLPGIIDTANQVLLNSQVAPSLGRNLSSGAFVLVGIVPQSATTFATAGGLYDQRLNETDLRFSRTFTFGREHIKALFDIYNIFNNRPPQAIASTYGPSWLLPTSLLGGRLFKFGGQFTF